MGTTLARTFARSTTGSPTYPANVPLAPEPADQRFVYGADPIAPGIDPAMRMNRPVRRRHRSPFLAMFIVLGVSLLIVFYIWNKIRVQQLTADVADLQKQYEKLVNVNGILKAEITQKSRLERIERIAVEQLHMTYPKEQPVWFDIDPEKARSIQ